MSGQRELDLRITREQLEADFTEEQRDMLARARHEAANPGTPPLPGAEQMELWVTLDGVQRPLFAELWESWST
jgi:hypothetical protein